MSDKTKIEWTDATWNPITGCSVVSPGCKNCYAMKLAGGRLKHHKSRIGLTEDSDKGPVWNGQVRLNGDWLDQPLRWKRPRRIFVCAHGDLFHENIPDSWIHNVLEVMARCPQHQFQVLTKRPDRMQYFMNLWVDWYSLIDGREKRFLEWPLENIWLGVSVEDQKRADERIPLLLETPARVRFISAEPLLGEIDLRMLHHDHITNVNALTGRHGMEWPLEGKTNKLDWVIVGGESGPGARPMEKDWARSLRDQCVEANVPYFFKQHGGANKKETGRVLDGRTWDEMPVMDSVDPVSERIIKDTRKKRSKAMEALAYE